MREAELSGSFKKRWRRPSAGSSDGPFEPNVLAREFEVAAPCVRIVAASAAETERGEMRWERGRVHGRISEEDGAAHDAAARVERDGAGGGGRGAAAHPLAVAA